MEQLQLDFEIAKSDADEYDYRNPQVWKMFSSMALTLIGKGRKHYGAKSIFEVMRFHTAIKTSEPDFKLNNNYTAYYARKFHKTYPQHDGFFELRKSRVITGG